MAIAPEILIPQLHFCRPNERGIIEDAQELIQNYANQGFMVGKTVDQLTIMAMRRNLLVATHNKRLVGTVGITTEYPGKVKELGGLAVDQEYTRHRVGLALVGALVSRHVDLNDGSKIIAFANNKSEGLFTKLGAKEIEPSFLNASDFLDCRDCKCAGKENLPPGRFCVDKTYDLSVIDRNMIKDRLGYEPKAALSLDLRIG